MIADSFIYFYIIIFSYGNHCIQESLYSQEEFEAFLYHVNLTYKMPI